MPNNDLISRAALLKDLSYCAPELWQDEEYIKAKIMKQHAVDAVPVVHGRWIDHKDEHQCSACKEFTVVDAYAWIQLRYDFCPYCGAKMDGEQEG